MAADNLSITRSVYANRAWGRLAVTLQKSIAKMINIRLEGANDGEWEM